MKVLIRQARIIDPSSPFNGTIKDILVEDGLIISVNDKIDKAPQTVIEAVNLHVSIGWMDVFAHFNDPGFEHRETLESGAMAAAAGGFTDVMVIPNTQPAVSAKSQVEYIIQRSHSLLVNIIPIGSITKNADGKELAEMYDMHTSGAMAFSDGTKGLQTPGILSKALQYMLAINGTLIQLPDDKSISAHGLMNEGVNSTRLGLPGIPAIAEELMIARDIELLRYTKSRLHITGVSTAKGIRLIRDAKKEGLHISCSATPYHAWFSDADLEKYDTNMKVNPPLRTNADREAVKEGFINKDIDCIASHHLPQHLDDKMCEFEYAKPGMSGLETVFPVMKTLGLELNHLVEMLSIAPRKIFNMDVPSISEGSQACLTLFDPEKKYIFDQSLIRSKCNNNPFVGREFTGKVIGIVNKKSYFLNS